MKYIKRLLGLPFFMGLLAIGMVWHFVLKTFWWVKYGGEVINYNDKINRTTVNDVFLALKGAIEESKSDN